MSNRSAVNPRMMSYTGIYFEPCLTSKFNKNCRKRSFWDEAMEFITYIMGVQQNCVPVRDKLILAISEMRVNDSYHMYFISIRSMCAYDPRHLFTPKPGHTCHGNVYHLIVDSRHSKSVMFCCKRLIDWMRNQLWSNLTFQVPVLYISGTQAFTTKYGITSVPAWISNHMPSKVWADITNQFHKIQRPLKCMNGLLISCHNLSCCDNSFML